MFLTTHKTISYLEHAALSVKEGSLIVTKSEFGKTWLESIPHKTTSLLLLGPGTSLTNDAAYLLSEEDVLIVFCSGNGAYPSLAKLNYKNNAYAQKWVQRWMVDRLDLSRKLLSIRFANSGEFHGLGTESLLEKVNQASSIDSLMGLEGSFVKMLYRNEAEKYGVKFRREPDGGGVNAFLTHGNYLAYGIASLALHALNIPSNFPLIHGQTRDGGLVFDLADVIKDTMVLTLAFQAWDDGLDEKGFREILLTRFRKKEVLSQLINIVKELLEEH